MVTVTSESRRRLEEKFFREAGGKVLAALDDPDVIEVILNPDGHVWVETHSAGMAPLGDFMEGGRAESFLGTVAALLGRVVSPESPMLEGELPDGSRFQGVLPPISPAPAFVIRRRAGRIYSLEEYVSSQMLAPEHCAALREAIYQRENIVIAGGTGSGKTTLANAILSEMVVLGDTRERFVILEDTLELQCYAPNTLQLHTGDAADLTRLLRATMRLRPDRIIIGEVRGAEALALLKAWNTGHPGGLTTIHASSALGALRRIESLVQEGGVKAQPEVIAEAVGLLVFMTRAPGGGRRVTEVAKVTGWSRDSGYDLAPIPALERGEGLRNETQQEIFDGFGRCSAGGRRDEALGSDERADDAVGHTAHDHP